jgi:hypothetical protein
MEDKIWFSPLNIVVHFETDFQGIRVPKKAGEMMAVAITMAIAQELHKKQYWIQGILDSEQSPDVRTMYAEERKDGKAPWGCQQDIEIVKYTKYSAGMNLAEFVAKTKLGPNYAYDDQTIILVDVQSGARLPSANEWSAALSATGKHNQVLVLGRINLRYPHYRLAIVHPIPEAAIDYDPYVLLKKQGYMGVMKWSRGTEVRQVKNINEKHCPFEKFGIKCRLI